MRGSRRHLVSPSRSWVWALRPQTRSSHLAMMNRGASGAFVIMLGMGLVLLTGWALPAGAQAEEYESIDSSACGDCHEKGSHDTLIAEDLEHSVHAGFECLDCHTDRGTIPHRETESCASCASCRSCHDDADAAYTIHGRAKVGESEDLPHCHDCHGDHDVLPSNVKHSRTNPLNLPQTCGTCHQNVALTRKYDILIDRPIEIYQASVHGKAMRDGISQAASCNDCHSSGGTAHKILAPGFPESSVNHFNIPTTCGRCHQRVASDFWEGIHGKLVARGETDAPVCTHCHGEHGILSPDNPLSPVSRARVAEATCSPCHESVSLNEKYGLPPGRLATFIDSYHGLKTKAGDPRVANCASCHGYHRILPSNDPTSTVYPDNLQRTCGQCHPKISVRLASTPIHGVSGEGLRTPAAEVVEQIYIVAIFLIIGLMVIHWLLDLGRHMVQVLRARPQVRRMWPGEVMQHALLAMSFVILVVSGFALRYSESWLTRLFFGWAGGFEVRGLVHRVAAVIFIGTVVWHVLFMIASRRGRHFVADMRPLVSDFVAFYQRIMYCVGLRDQPPRFGRFSYVEKAEYWALVWGTAVMVATGLLLWFDNWVVQMVPKGVLDVALVVHYWEAWLATLAIAVWHLYSTVFSPHVYPMNPSWLTGTMPEAMYRHEHPDDLEAARKDTERFIQVQLEKTQFSENAAEEISDGSGASEDPATPEAPPDERA